MQEMTSPQVEQSESCFVAPDMTEDWRENVSQILDSSYTHRLSRIFCGIWLLGMMIGSGIYYLGWRRLKSILCFSEPVEQEHQMIFDRCYEELNLKKEIILLQSDLVDSPMSLWWKQAYIVLPKKESQSLSYLQMEHILLHELMHFKHKDLEVNCICLVLQLMYWFNPFVEWAFSRMRLDQEAYCDWEVLKVYSCEEERICYGETLLYFARPKKKYPISMAHYLIQNKNQLKYRIEQIVCFEHQDKKAKLTGKLVCVLWLISIISQMPILATVDNRFGVTYQPDHSLKFVEHPYLDIFDGNRGCAVIHELKTEVYEAYNAPDITKRVAPCSTYKIFSAINALEKGIITPSDNKIKWDCLERGINEWDKDQCLNEAIKNSVNWYFQSLDQQVGISELSQFYRNIGYGNGYIGSDSEYYWNGGSLKISPLEQVQLLEQLYLNDFHFNEKNLETLQKAMFISEQNGNRLYGKTGTGKRGEHEVCGWFIGYVEMASHQTYFFAVNLQGEDGINGKKAKQVTQAIFDKMKIEMNTES